MNLTVNQRRLHQHAVRLSRKYSRLEWQLVAVLIAIEKSRLFRKIGHSSLFKYAVIELNLSEAVAYSFISVARKADQNPSLKQALKKRELTVSKASRIAAVIHSENAEGLIEFAKSHSSREIDIEVARINPRARVPDRAKPLSEDLIHLQLSVSIQFYANLQRAQSVAAQKGEQDLGFEQTLGRGLQAYLDQFDPVRKAQRAEKRPPREKKFCANRMSKARMALTAEQKHAVFARDGGRCTYKDDLGHRCETDRWLHIHHIRPVSEGGGNEAENLTTLCSFHHNLVHQLRFDFAESERSHVRECAFTIRKSFIRRKMQFSDST